ncbi:MAG: alkaline phosphatase family protein [Acidobacteria bacterium]|nr:alkaline phosphatase family protein [Acidobacteriota bacterium]
MRYLRMLTNSVIGGAAFALYLTVLVLQLNPRYSLAGVPALAATILLSYGVHVSAAFYALIVFRQLVATDVISPGWISFRFLVWVCTAAAVLGAVLMWVNLRGFGTVLDVDAFRRMTGGAASLSICAAVMAALAFGHRWAGRHSSRVGAVVLGLTLMASLAAPLMLRGPGTEDARPARWPSAATETPPPPGERRVVLVLLEGASLDLLAPAAAEGRLPHFEHILESGASMHVATIRPTQAGTVWTAVATGKLPYKNGVRSAALYYPLGGREALEILPDYCFSHILVYLGLVREQVHASRDLTARPLWNLLSSQGVSVGVVNWSVTLPARDVRGFLVSDQFDAIQARVVDIEGANAVWPREALATAMAAVSQAARNERPPTGQLPDAVGPLVSRPCRSDRTYEQVMRQLDERYASRFLAVRYECLDSAGHYLLRYAAPRAFGDVTDDELQKYGSALSSFYAAADEALGRAADALRPGDLLLVASGFGMEPMSVAKRLLERTLGNPEPSGTHERAPDGFLLAYGADVQPGRLPRGSVVDLAPTILYFFGLPVARDMDGFARTDIFTQSFTQGRPITYIPTYER